MTSSSVFARPTSIALAVASALATLTTSSVFAQEASPTVLPEIKVIGSAQSGYGEKTSISAMKTDTLLRDTPQSVTVITRQLMDDQVMQSIADAIRYVPGIVTAQGEGNRDTAVFRGNSSTSDFYIDGMRDDVQYYRDFYNIASVEAIKGPNAMIFGRGGSGGVINRVSKQAGWHAVREAAISAGSNGHKRASVDIGSPINDNVAVRVNAMAEQSDSYRNDVTLERKGINPTLTLRAGKKTVVNLGYEHFRDDRIADRGVPSLQNSGRPYNTDESTFFGNPELSPTAVRVNALTANLEHDFGNNLVLRNRTRIANYDKFYQNVYANGAVNAASGQVLVGAYHDATERTNRFNQTDLTFSITTGAVKHKLATGVEFGRQETDNIRRNGVFASTASVPATNPVYTGGVGFPSPTTSNYSIANVASVYVQDQIVFSPQWQAVAGVRYDRFSIDFKNRLATSAALAAFDVTDTPVSPRAGLIYKPVEAMSLYASFSRAYVPRAGEQLTSLTATNRAFDPEQFDNRELGMKWDLTPDLSASAAIYKLDRSNVVVTPVAGTSILVDGQTTKGVELELSGQFTPAWSVMGGYAYQDAELTADQSPTIKRGAKLAMVPKHTFSMWNRYNFNQQLGAGLGLVYRDSLYTSTGNTVTLPSFTRVDAAVFYRLSKQYRLQLNVENLFDKQYWASAHNDNNITPGAPRSVKMSLFASF